MHGIPVVVKDMLDVVGLPTTGGTTLLQNGTPRRDAFVVARLREQGAIVFAKANLDELQMGGAGRSTLGGQTKNPCVSIEFRGARAPAPAPVSPPTSRPSASAQTPRIPSRSIGHEFTRGAASRRWDS